ncbi:MAG TPA: NAD-dependent deacylase [Rhodocyclaceae bacterium]|nr:NAD-dependent deacylase [Rhodocyclaceae bacterium]
MVSDVSEDLWTEIAELCAGARRLLFITGAGISADSGLPTYRGIGGLYDSKLTDEGIAIEEALSGQMLALRPEITWKYIAQIEANCRGVRPNAAHEAIAWLEARLPEVTVLTQNIDGLHRAAGSRDVIEIHGTLHRLSCTDCGRRMEVSDYAGLGLPPLCAECGGLLRPDVVLFGEALPQGAIQRLIAVLDQGVDLVFSIGTTSVFPYIAEPVLYALRCGVPTVEINPGESRVSDHVRYRLRLGAAAAMDEIRRRLVQLGV